VQRLNRELGIILAASEMNALLARLSFRSLNSTPQEFAALIRAEHTKWSAVIRDAGLRLE
jgi:tripartite-type tricarboxylate transporter receptor subunit TctC